METTEVKPRRGRPKGSKNKSHVEVVKGYSVDKEKSIEQMQAKKSLSITPEVVNKFDIKPVARTSMLGGHAINYFSGKNYEDSLRMAYTWRDQQNKKENGKKIELLRYFAQPAFSTVLVSYNFI